jgi:hypothetical protein
MIVGPGEANVFGEGSLFNGGLKIATESINAAGGIEGHMIKLLTCDSGQPFGTIQGLATCTQQVLADHPIALLGAGLLPNSASFFAAITPQSIPVLIDSDAGGAADTNPLAWDIEVSPNFLPAYDLLAASKGGCKNVAMFIPVSTDTDAPQEGYYKAVASSLGMKSEQIAVSQTATDFAPFVAQAEQAGADCIDIITNSTTLVPTYNAIKDTGKSIKLVANDLTNSEANLVADGPAANGITLATVMYPPGATSSPQLAADWAKYGGGTPQNDIQKGNWEIVQIFAMAAKKMLDAGLPVSAASIQRELGTLSNISLGLQPPLDFSRPSTITGEPRNFSTEVGAYVYSNGKFTSISSSPLSLPSGVPVPNFSTAM